MIRWLGIVAIVICHAAYPSFASAHPVANHNVEKSSFMVNLNSATTAELQSLPGIGRQKALAIIAYRKKRRFRNTAEVIRIRGIGRKTFRKLRSRLTVKKMPKK